MYSEIEITRLQGIVRNLTIRVNKLEKKLEDDIRDHRHHEPLKKGLEWGYHSEVELDMAAWSMRELARRGAHLI